MQTGKEIIINYCKNVQCHDIDYLSNCENNLIILEKENIDYNMLEGCPSSMGLDNFEGDCYKEDIDINKPYDQDKQCQNCWKRALNTTYENKTKGIKVITNAKYMGELPKKQRQIEEDETTQLLKKLYKVAHDLDYELCTVLNNYILKPDYKSIGTYRLPEKYEGEWMKVIDEVEKYLGIYEE